MNLNKSLESVQEIVAEFAKERDWDQFHSIKNLSMALGVEVSELMEFFQWSNNEEDIKEALSHKREKIEDEMIDIFIYWLRLATKMDLDIDAAFERKFGENQKKYPAEKVRGSSKKYSDY